MANQFFNAAYYLAQNPDVATAGFTLATAEQHYLKFGANEGRAPNPYFNATQYLLQYPDLIAAGVTKATALQHYAQYGINEGRSPSVAANPADFSYAQYAAANADLRTAFGITDATGATLTAAQQHSLLGHFLSYGYVESRPGVVAVNGDTYFTTLSTSISFAVNVTPDVNTFNGSAGNDLFTVAGIVGTTPAATLNGATINGFAGTDTLTVANLSGGAVNTVTLNSIEKIIINSTNAAGGLTVLGNSAGTTSLSVNDTSAFTYTGAKVDALSLLGAGAVTGVFSAASVAGSTDALALTVGPNVAPVLTVNGIETFTIAEGAASGLTLNASGISGTTLSVTETGGAAGAATNVAVNVTGSTSLTTVKVDLSASASSHIVTVSAGDVDTTVTGGAGADTLSGSAQATLVHTNTLSGGAGIDTLNASGAIDVLTGGTGADTFAFASGSGAARTATANGVTTITATDSITDFGAGDKLALVGTGFAADGSFAAGTANAGTIVGGVLTFTANPTVLSDAINAVDTYLNNVAGGSAVGTEVLFKFGADSYLLHTTVAGAAGAGNTLANVDLIKIVGIEPAHLALAFASGVTFVA